MFERFDETFLLTHKFLILPSAFFYIEFAIDDIRKASTKKKAAKEISFLYW